MNTRLRIGKTYKSQLLYVVLIPAFFVGFCFLYNPFSMQEYYTVGNMSFGFHFVMLATILMGILALTRLVFSVLSRLSSSTRLARMVILRFSLLTL